jgi:hypothetical protein
MGSTLQGGSNQIVRNGLVLNLDAANPSSYISGSSTWFDISSTSTNGTLSNVTFDSGSGGSLVFNGSTSFIRGTDVNGILNVGASGYATVSTFIQSTSTSPQQIIFLYGASTSQTLNYNIGLSNGLIRGNNAALGTTYIFPNQWYGVTVTFAGTTVTSYINGVAAGTSTRSTTTTTGTTWGIGANITSNSLIDQQFYGKIGLLRVYNRQLSSTEILQNFTASKKRFNI